MHGLWLLPSSWDAGRRAFEEAGYATVAPGRPEVASEASTFVTGHAPAEGSV